MEEIANQVEEREEVESTNNSEKPEEPKKKNKHLFFWIAFPIGWTLLNAIALFYFDLANGPLVWFILELIFLAVFFVVRVLLRDKKFWIRLLTWVGFVALTVGVVLLNQPQYRRKAAFYYNNPVKIAEPLQLNQGKVQGFYNEDQTVKVYAGIKYAQAERWKEPKEYTWEGIQDGTYFGPRSMQPKSNPFMDTLTDIYSERAWRPSYIMHPYQDRSEDGLYLNIWRPNTTATNLPILVYIHGGSLTNGSSADNDINGESMAKLGVIMITIQYRLGVFGYFAHPDLKAEALAETGHATTGNYGLLDQVYALKWINENAVNFGGDKNNITIAGESAGSSSVSALCSTPLASGLFKRAIGESSSLVIKKAPHTYRKEADAYKISENILAEFKCSTIEQLRTIPAEKLVETKFKNQEMMMDGYALTKDPYQVYLDHENNEEALLNGYNVKEADGFVIPMYLFNPINAGNIKARLIEGFGETYGPQIYDLYKPKIDADPQGAFCEIYSVYWFIMPHHSWSNMALANGVNVYRYQFTKMNGYREAYHSGEIIYAYGNLAKSHRQYAYNASDYELQNTMMNYWANFAKTGNPNGGTLPTWNKYNSSTDPVMELGSNVGSIADKYLNLYNILDQYLDSVIASE